LDGETNLKICRAPDETMNLNDINDISKFQAIIECDPPQPHLYTFTGSMKCYAMKDAPEDPETPVNPEQMKDGMLFQIPISIKNVLLRGCMLRNTEWVLGLVIFSGADTKIRLNSGATPLKRSVLENKMNLFT
jgi:phospholipid-translocating ATPase